MFRQVQEERGGEGLCLIFFGDNWEDTKVRNQKNVLSI